MMSHNTFNIFTNLLQVLFFWIDRKYVIIETRHDKWYAELSSKCFRRISKLISLKYDSGEHDLMQP